MIACHCGSTHMGRPCPPGMTFRDRMRTVRLDASVTESRTRRNYYDREAVREVFGPDSREQLLEETRGLGAIQRAADGSEWVNDDPTTGEMRPLERSDLIGGYLRGEVVDEIDA